MFTNKEDIENWQLRKAKSIVNSGKVVMNFAEEWMLQNTKTTF